MAMKIAERKEAYANVLKLMLECEHKKAFEALVCMLGEDTGIFWLVDYDEAVKASAMCKPAQPLANNKAGE